jgi:hypothetical protein
MGNVIVVLSHKFHSRKGWGLRNTRHKGWVFETAVTRCKGLLEKVRYTDVVVFTVYKWSILRLFSVNAYYG